MVLELALLGGAVLLLRSQPRQLAPSTPPAAKDPVPSTNGNPDTTAGGPSVEEILKSDEAKGAAGAAATAVSGVGGIAIPIVATGAALAVAIVGVVEAFNAAASRDELLRNRAGAGNKFEWDTGNLSAWVSFMRGPRGALISGDAAHQHWGLVNGKFLPAGFSEASASEAWFLFADGYVRKFDYRKTLKLPDGAEGQEILETLAITDELLRGGRFPGLVELHQNPAQEIRVLTPLVDDAPVITKPPAPPPLLAPPPINAPPPGAWSAPPPPATATAPSAANGPPPPAPGTSPPVESLAAAEVVKATQPVPTSSSSAPATNLAAPGGVMQFIGYVPPSGGFGSF